MLLRSSSTPIPGSLLPNSSSSAHFSESPNHHPHQPISFHCFSSHLPPPLSDSSDHQHNHIPSSIRRARSDGNLDGLLPDHPDHSSHRHSLNLESILSFSVYNNSTSLQEEEDQEEEGEDYDEQFYAKSQPEKAKKSDMFTFSCKEEREKATVGAKMPPLFLARGLGIDRLGSGLLDAGGGFGGGNCSVLTGRGGDYQSELEMYYKKMLEENPRNALFLSNYAQFLYEAKGDARRAEEYYSRAMLAEPGDGEVLSKYARLVWEIHHDEERASSYFEQAVQAAPQDSHVLAAYAGFLWDTEDDDNGEEARDGALHEYSGGQVSFGTMAFASA